MSAGQLWAAGQLALVVLAVGVLLWIMMQEGR